MKKTNSIDKTMEFLMSELHKEWDRTGATKASVLISLEEVEEVNKTLVATIMKRQEQADKGRAEAVASSRWVHDRDMKTGNMMRFPGAEIARSARAAFNHHVLNAAL